MKRFFLIGSLLLTSLFANAQDFQKRFLDLSSKNDTTALASLLKDWEAKSPKDPELYIAYFNYYVKKSAAETISLDKDQKGPESLAISDSTGREVGYLNNQVMYLSENVERGIEQINRGIALHPNRLDMRFGKIYILGETGDYKAFTNSIIEAIEYGNKINNQWLWKEGKPLENESESFLSSIQGYVGTLYNTEDDALLPYMRQISETVLKYQPKHVESLSNVALTYMIVQEYDKAIPYLLKAEEAAPRDIVVLNNLAETYKRKNDVKAAKAYFEKVIKYGNKEEARDAKVRLKKL